MSSARAPIIIDDSSASNSVLKENLPINYEKGDALDNFMSQGNGQNKKQTVGF